MKIAIGNDHAGTEYKVAIVAMLQANNHEIINFGTNSIDSADYADFGHAVARDVHNTKVDLGIIICGSANGIAMAANKHQNVRAAVCWTTEIAALSRQHNNANVIAIPARYTSILQAVDMVNVFLKTNFEGGRHISRVEKISCS